MLLVEGSEGLKSVTEVCRLVVQCNRQNYAS